MTNIKFTQVISLPVQSEKGCVYFVSDGTLHLGKSDGTFLQLAKSDSDVLFVTSLPTDNVEENKLYVLLSEGKLTIHIYDGTQFIELSHSTHQHEVSDINNLQTILDAKLDSALLTVVSNRLDSHEIQSLASETGIHNIRYFDNKLEYLAEDGWTSIISSNGSTSTIADIVGLQDELDKKVDKTVVDSLRDDLTQLDTNVNSKIDTNTSDITTIKNQLNNNVANVNHKHEIEDVNELRAELDSKAKATDFNALKTQFTGHKHTIADVDTLQTALDSKSPLNHNHQWSQITGRPTSNPTQIDALVDNQHTHPNLDLLNLFEDGNGTLIYNGNPLGEVAYLSVQTITDRDNIPVDARKEGLMVMVLDDGSMYYLKGGTDNAFWEIFATGSGGATNASTLPATPSGNLTGVNVQSLLDELEAKKANMSDVYTKAETENYMKGYTIDYSTLENLPDLSTLHGHENKETLDLFSQFQGNLTWAGKTLGDLVTEIYDADKNGVIDKAQTLDGMTAKIEEINYLSGVTGNLQSQINAISSGVTFKGEFATYQEMLDNLPTPSKGDLVYIKTDENKDGAVDTQYCFDGTEWVYGGGTTKVPDATITTKGVIQLGGDLSHPNSTASAPKLNTTGVTAGLYRNPLLTIDESGRISHAEEGTTLFLNDTITSSDEVWSSQKISDELAKKAERNHTHPQLHDANKIGSVTVKDETPSNEYVLTYDQTLAQAVWKEAQGGKTYVGSKFVKGDIKIVGGSYITLALNEETGELVINSTYREGGGNVIATGYEILESIKVLPSSSVRFSAPATYNKFMLHTVQMNNDKNVTSELRIYNQSPSEDFAGYIEYNSNPEISISDIVNIPIFDYDNSKSIHFEVVNLGIEEATFNIRLKCTNLL